MPLSIGVITFNQEAVYWSQIEAEEFLPRLYSYVAGKEVIVFGLQESPESFAGQVSKFLPRKHRREQLMEQWHTLMTNNHYRFVQGKEALSLGKAGIRGLRLGVFTRLKNVEAVTNYAHICHNITWKKDQKHYFQKYGKGSVGLTIKAKGISVALVNTHLPFFGDQGPDQGLEARLGCLRLVMDEIRAQHARVKIILGDLNFRVTDPALKPAEIVSGILNDSVTVKKRQKWIEKDQLYRVEVAFKHTVDPRQRRTYLFQEGLFPHTGPHFAPTCKWKKQKKPLLKCDLTPATRHLHQDCYVTGRTGNYRLPSWCDRILCQGASCLSYDAIRVGPMQRSDHAAVIGTYMVQ